MKKEDYLELAFLISAVVVMSTFISVMLFDIQLIEYMPIINDLTSLLVIFVLIIVLYIYLTSIYIKPFDYSVAIVGYPQTGKTTLIVSIFIEAFEKKIKVLRQFTPRGNLTIEKINKYIALLKEGKALGPTTDQDIFSYKSKIVVKQGLFNRAYNLRIGDFPGNDSRTFCEYYEEWWHTSDYYKWVQESDAIMYVVDLAPYLMTYGYKEKYISNMIKVARAAWNSYADVNEFRNNKIINNPILLLFTKADLLNVININELKKYDDASIKKMFNKKGYGLESFNIEMDNELFEINKRIVLNDFSDIISYFNSEINHFTSVFVSSYGLIDNKRIGFEKIFNNLIE